MIIVVFPLCAPTSLVLLCTSSGCFHVCAWLVIFFSSYSRFSPLLCALLYFVHLIFFRWVSRCSPAQRMASKIEAALGVITATEAANPVAVGRALRDLGNVEITAELLRNTQVAIKLKQSAKTSKSPPCPTHVRDSRSHDTQASPFSQ